VNYRAHVDAAGLDARFGALVSALVDERRRRFGAITRTAFTHQTAHTQHPNCHITEPRCPQYMVGAKREGLLLRHPRSVSGWVAHASAGQLAPQASRK
jgi:hypothetical protein